MGLASRQGQHFSLLQYVRTASRAHPAACLMATGLFPGVKRPGSEVNRLPPCRTKAELEWRYISAPHIFFRDVKRDNFACNLRCNMFRPRSDAGVEDYMIRFLNFGYLQFLFVLVS